MYDILSNNKVVKVRASSAQTPGTATSPAQAIDLFSGGLANRALLIIDVTAVAVGGKLTITAQDSNDNSTFDADFITFAQITATGFYLAVIDDPERYLRFSATVADANVTWNAYLITFEEQRRPVTQSADAVLAATYGTGRKAKVAAS